MRMDDVERISRLEERLAWFERHAVEQDRAMLELAEQVSRLRKELAEARDANVAGSKPELGPIADERPPHY